MNRDRLDRFIGAFEGELVQLLRETSLDRCSPSELITVILGCVVRSRKASNTGPEGTRILVGPGHTRTGQSGEVVGVESVNGQECYSVRLHHNSTVPGGTVLVPSSMCLPADAPIQVCRPIETVTQLYSRNLAETAAAASQESTA